MCCEHCCSTGQGTVFQCVQQIFCPSDEDGGQQRTHRARSPYRYHDHLIRFTAVGIELPQTDTVKIEMDGEWKDGKYGLQLQVDHWQEIVPPTLEGVRNYLASGLLKASEKRPPT